MCLWGGGASVSISLCNFNSLYVEMLSLMFTDEDASVSLRLISLELEAQGGFYRGNSLVHGLM